MYKWEKYHENDPKNPTFSSSLLDQINKSLKNNPKQAKEEDLSFFRATKSTKKREEEKMSSLRRACMVEKWMEKKVSDKVMKKSKSRSSTTNTLLEEFDVQDSSTMFFSTTSTSSSSSENDYSVFTHSHSRQKPRVPCFAPPMPKSVRTRPIESKYLEQLEDDNSKEGDTFAKSRSKAVKMYSNLKSLKQPISPGMRLTGFINSLFTKDNNKKSKSTKSSSTTTTTSSSVTKQCKSSSEKVRVTSYSTCTTPSSYSRSCLSTKKKFQEDGIKKDDGSKRTVSFCPVSVILNEDSRPCGYKSLFEEGHDRISTSKFARSLSKRYEELKKLNGLEKECDRLQQQKKLEEVALDLLSGYWDSRLSKSHDQCSNDKVNDYNYGANHGGNYVQHEDDDDDGLSCASSDLFELDHLSLIGNELPVYETTQFDRP